VSEILLRRSARVYPPIHSEGGNLVPIEFSKMLIKSLSRKRFRTGVSELVRIRRETLTELYCQLQDAEGFFGRRELRKLLLQKIDQMERDTAAGPINCRCTVIKQRRRKK